MKEKLFHSTSDEQREFISRITSLLQKCEGVIFAYVYGSFAEGQSFHDIDIGLFLDDENVMNDLEYALETGHRLSRALGCPVDVRILNHAPVSFRYNVLKGQLIFGGSEEVHDHFVEDAVRRYLDMKPLLLNATREAFAHDA